MKKIAAILLFFCIAFACKKPVETTEDLKNKLKKTMTEYLYKAKNLDSNQVKFHITDVVYFENPDDYVCEFKVQMRENNKDTTGTMSARISKDMTRVFRRF